MNKKEKASIIAKILDEYFPKPEIPLQHKDAYTLLIAVLMSAQCTDVQVNKITPSLFAKADRPQKMVKLSAEEIENIIRPCGLAPRKSKAILELSKILLEKYNGCVPRSFEELEALPGVGHKTASVVMAQAFGLAAFPVDTHIFRCAIRWGLSSGKNVTKVEEDLKKLFPKKDWIKIHLQIIFFARTFCQAKAHDKSLCPICSWLEKPRK